MDRELSEVRETTGIRAEKTHVRGVTSDDIRRGRGSFT